MKVKRVYELCVGDVVLLFGIERVVASVTDTAVKMVTDNRNIQELPTKSKQRVEVISEAKKSRGNRGS